MRTWTICGLSAAVLVLGPVPGFAADAPPKAAEGVLIVIDSAGKEQQLKSWKFLAGTRHLSWLAPAAAEEKPGAKDEAPRKGKGVVTPRVPTGPETLELREDNSTTFKEGILTLVPLDRIRKIDYDNEDKKVAVTVAIPGDKGEEVLTGTTRFIGVNKLVIEAEIDLGDLGTGTVKFQGGAPKGIRGIRFPRPKAGEALTGRPADITVADKEKAVHKVVDPQPLYRLTGVTYRLIPTLLFQKTVKIDLAKIQSLRRIESEDSSTGGKDYEVTLKDGKQVTLTLLDNVSPLDGTLARLEGFVVRVPAGYKLFPMHLIGTLQFEGKSAAP
jgi:hypothetical protein